MSSRILTPLIIFVSALSSGCLSWFDLDRAEFDLSKLLETGSTIGIQRDGGAACNNPTQQPAKAPTIVEANKMMQSLPTTLRITKVMTTTADVFEAVLNAKTSREIASLKLNSKDFEVFTEEFERTLLKYSLYDKAKLARGAADETTPIFAAYYKSYIDGKFINRRGMALSKPEITKDGIGNDTISAIFSVLLEAAADSVLRTPVFKDGDTYLNHGQTEPTAVTLAVVDAIQVVPSGQCGISSREVDYMRFSSELAGDQADTVSAMVLESFGGAEVSLVLGGHFSVGDNKTLATIVKTFFEHLFRRVAEYVSFKMYLETPLLTTPTAQRVPVDIYTELEFLGTVKKSP